MSVAMLQVKRILVTGGTRVNRYTLIGSSHVAYTGNPDEFTVRQLAKKEIPGSASVRLNGD